MQINSINRPFNRKHRPRYNLDPYYQSSSWRKLRLSFRQLSTIMHDGYRLSNKYCAECYRKSKSIMQGSNTDHIVQRIKGGEDTHSNLQTLCNRHHAIKSANEGNTK